MHVNSSTNTQPITYNPVPRTKVEILQYLVSRIALAALNIYAIWLASGPWSIGFFVGFLFHEEIKNRVTDLFSILNWKIMIPTAGFLYWLSLPYIVTMQIALAGADMGSRLALTAKNHKGSLMNLIWFKG